MSNSQKNRYISYLVVKPKFTFPPYLTLSDALKVIQSPTKDIDHQNKVNNSPTTRTEIPILTVISDLPQSLTSTPLGGEKSIEDLIDHMKNEEQRMKQEMKYMEFSEERKKYKIRLMKYREHRMKHEIELMRRREKPVEEVVSVWTPIYDNEKSMNNEIERMKKREKHMTYEIERMEHYQIRLRNEIRSRENEIKHVQSLSAPEERVEIRHRKIIFNEYGEKIEELCNELGKRQLMLREHSNEIRKRRTKLEEHSANRIEHENELKKIHDKINQEEERIEQEKQSRRRAIEEREYYEKMLSRCRAKRLKAEIDLLESTIKLLIIELQLMENDDEKRGECLILYRRLNEELLIKWTEFDITHEVEEAYWKKTASRSSRQISETYFNCTCIVRSQLSRVPPSKHAVSYSDYEISVVTEQPKYDIFISSANQNSFIIQRITNTLPNCFSTHFKSNFSSTNIKICLDNTSTAVIAIITITYELSETCQADIIHIFKRQFPLVLIISDHGFHPSTNWLRIVWQASSTQKIFLESPDFEKNLRNAITDAQWKLSPDLNISKMTRSITSKRSKRFLGDLHEWTIAYSNPAQVSHNYRQLINDPLRIDTDIKLQDIYYKYIRIYFENPDVMELFKEGANQNDMCKFIQAYTQAGPVSATLNRHLAANILFYFEPTLYEDVDYQLVKCLIDIVALCIYRKELSQYLFNGTVYRGVVMSEEDLLKYIVGSRIMNTSFLSTSKDKEVAEFFSGQKQQEFAVLCTFVISNNSNRRTALDIGYLSCFPEEREVLILPFSAFYVKSVARPSDRSEPVEMKLIEDDLDISENIDTLTFSESF